MAPFKRMRQPKVTTQALLDFDLGESSSDSDFLPDNNGSDGSKDGSDGEGDSSDASSSDSDSNDDSDCDSDDDSTEQQLLEENNVQPHVNGINGFDCDAVFRPLEPAQLSQAPPKRMCCVCLGERSDDVNEIVECDACGVTVHEGCYGVSDNVSISSTNSTCSTEPWFCEACRAGVFEPDCELCPNKGGIYKETDVGKWVHLICALYVPGVAFGEVDQLSSVTLFEMQYSKWGAKQCSLCENSLFARSGVCIGCDAGMCKTYFHVTCAQVAGLLIEAHHDDDAADPFYAHCKVHSEKEMIKKRRRNYHTLRLNMLQKAKERAALEVPGEPNPAQARIQRKLLKIQQKYAQHKQLKPMPWVPTQKMSRLLTTSASACRRLLAKAEVMSVDVQHLEQREAHINALTDIRKKWHIAPAFSVEFVAYYMDRIVRMQELKQEQQKLILQNSVLSKEQDLLRAQYDTALEDKKAAKATRDALSGAIKSLHAHLANLCPNLGNLPSVDLIAQPLPEPPKACTPPQRPISVPTAAALKMGVGFPLAHLTGPGSKLVDTTRMLSTQVKHEKTAPIAPTVPCGICKRHNDQHLLVKCDTCKLYYHLGCLNPPLTRPPKKSKLYGWQCSECCDKSDVSDIAAEISPGPRKSRKRFNKDMERYSLDEMMPNVKERRVLNKSMPESIELPSEEIGKQPAEKRTKALSSRKTIASVPIVANLEAGTETVIPPPASLSGCDDSIDDSLGKSARKGKRKDKHKSKRKKRSHADESMQDNQANLGRPIKIIFKTMRLPGEDAPESQYFYVPANAVRSVDEASRCTSVESVEDVTPVDQQPVEPIIETVKLEAEEIKEEPPVAVAVAPPISPTKRKVSPRKSSPRKPKLGRPRISNVKENVEINCCVCTQSGKSNQVVTCDECHKHYHFACLDPPLKKSPKIRGYSWHCADCDPTDDEVRKAK